MLSFTIPENAAECSATLDKKNWYLIVVAELAMVKNNVMDSNFDLCYMTQDAGVHIPGLAHLQFKQRIQTQATLVSFDKEA